MSQKANPAIRAVSDAAPQLRMGLQHRAQRGLILPDKRLGAVVLVPIVANREKLLDGDDKKTKLSAILPMFLVTPSSYLIDAKASRGRARFFLRHEQESAKTRRHKRPATYHFPSPCSLPSQPRRAARHILKRLPGKKKHSSFQVAG
jgi:hypothetical protein